MKVQQLVKEVYLLPLRTVNAYVIEAEDGLILIDAGTPGSAPRILEGIQAIGHKLPDLKTILLTHGHPDHVGGTAALKREVPQRCRM